MARRRQLKGIAENLAKWCLSRNFDSEGYWAIGKLYAAAKDLGVREIVLDVREKKFNPEPKNGQYSEAIRLLISILENVVKSNYIPEYWIAKVIIHFEYETEYVQKWHYFGSALGEPFKCKVVITSDLGRNYIHELGCNVWVHNPKKELCRYDF